MNSRADTTKVREAEQNLLRLAREYIANPVAFTHFERVALVESIDAALAALDSAAQEDAGPVATCVCFAKGRYYREMGVYVCKHGTYPYPGEPTAATPQPSPSEWERAYHYVTSRLPLDPQNRARDTTCPMQLAEIDRDLVDRFCQPSPSGPVAIKPLVWECLHSRYWRAKPFAHGVAAYYAAETSDPGKISAMAPDEFIGSFGDVDAAKAACEAHWQAYVRSLLADPAPVAKDVDLCEVARELERVAAEKAIRGASWAVINMAPPFRMAYWSACEEIAERIGVPYTDPDIPDAAAPVPPAHDAEGKVTGDPDDAEPANSIEFGLTRDNAGLGEREAWWMRNARIWRERAIALGWHEVRDTELPPPPSTNKGQT